MKTRNLVIIFAVAFLFPGCVIWSFYPFYSENDLFKNEILSGTWQEDDSTQWKFQHPEIQKDGQKFIDSTSYILSFNNGRGDESEFSVHLFKLEDTYFLDFYLENLDTSCGENRDKDIELWSLHVMPVHTIAKLTIEKDKLKIKWFDKGWLEDAIKEKQIKISHENDGNNLLLTAKTKELQKLIVKHSGDTLAFQKGIEVTLIKAN